MKNKIKNDMINAMKSGDTVARDILRVLTGEIQRNFFESDVDIIKLVKKMIQNNKDSNGDESEIEILEKYLPKQLSNDELINHARIYIKNSNLDKPSDMGKVMGYFKGEFGGLYDGKELSIIVKNLLK